jgi:hypothetical protein
MKKSNLVVHILLMIPSLFLFALFLRAFIINIMQFGSVFDFPIYVLILCLTSLICNIFCIVRIVKRKETGMTYFTAFTISCVLSVFITLFCGIMLYFFILDRQGQSIMPIPKQF